MDWEFINDLQIAIPGQVFIWIGSIVAYLLTAFISTVFVYKFLKLPPEDPKASTPPAIIFFIFWPIGITVALFIMVFILPMCKIDWLLTKCIGNKKEEPK
jgi:hypothetical protein